MAKPTHKPLPEANAEGEITIDKRYLIELRTENKALRLRVRGLVDEIAQLRGGNAEPVNPVVEQAI